MNVLLHCIYFPPEVGGLESHVYYLARGLVQRGHRVQVVTSRSLPGVQEHEVMEGIEVWRTWFPRRSPAGWIAHSLGSLHRTRVLARDSDIVHAQAFASVVPAAACRSHGRIPMVATFHTSHFLTRAERPLWQGILGRLVQMPDHALAASQEIADVAMGLAPGCKVEALANGVETDFFRRVEATLPREGRPRIVVPRRLFPKNGVDYFIRALPLILERVDVDAVFVGDGPERDHLTGLASSLGVAHRAMFLGKKPNEEMPGILSSADLAVIPSLMEATSVAALEAMACEVPVAASRVGGLPEIIGDDVGGLFEPRNPEDLAATVVRLLNDDSLGERGARARQKVVDHWSNHRLVERHLEIYQELLQQRDRR